jgi:16S rRNA processing protein RimM
LNRNKIKKNDFLKIGTVTAPHGVNGGVKIYFLPGSFLEIRKFKRVYFFLSNHFITYNISRVKGLNINPILFFENIQTLEDAKYLKDNDVYVLKEDLNSLKIKLPIELIESKVYTHGNNIIIGSLKAILKGFNYEFLEVEKADGTTILIPFTEDFAKKVDYEGKKIFISNDSGFLDDTF